VRRLIMLVVTTAALLAATAATAGGGPRLSGKFRVVGTIGGNDLSIPAGTKTNDVFAFKAACGSGACATVKLDRDGGNHKHYKSTLHRTAAGVYAGTEGPEPYDCPGTDAARFTARHTIKVTKARSGKATAIGGSTKIKITGCSVGTFVDYTLKGKLG
jgi:hypothetical protein